MSVIQELIRQESNGTISFGNYLLDSKKKVLDFEVEGDLYKVKTFKEITKLEKNGKMILEAVPGATVHNFTMTEKGLLSIDNPSEFFVTKREEGEMVSGSTITVIREGSRPVISEIESLVSNSFTPYPSRVCEAMKKDQMNTLISILEQKGKIALYDKNVVIKTTGGIKLKEQAVNLAVIMCIASSVYHKPIPWDYAFIADVGLTGELKKVPSILSSCFPSLLYIKIPDGL